MLEDGTRVRVHYRARLDNGEVIEDSTKTGVPFSFVIGSGEALPAFEDVVRQLQVGEHRELRVPAAQAYGERRDDLIDAIDKFDFMKEVKFETYASLRIRGSILDQIRKMDWIPRTIRQKQKQIDAVMKKIEQEKGGTAGAAGRKKRRRRKK